MKTAMYACFLVENNPPCPRQALIGRCTFCQTAEESCPHISRRMIGRLDPEDLVLGWDESDRILLKRTG
ncbi:MAG: hypothetical protein ACOZBH_03125 [Patescibacteria group bacterium]